MEICNFEKNVKNPNNGNEIFFTNTGMKEGLSNMLNIEGNKKLIDLMQKCDTKYPRVHEFMDELCKF